jgi:hypothetical protein
MTQDLNTLTVEEQKQALHEAWDDMIGELQAARDAIDNPALFPPEATSRVLAEGYRYLAGFVHFGVERAFHCDPSFPKFRNALSVYNKSTIENADAIYFYAEIDGRQRYRISGKAEDFRHWRGEQRTEGGKKAPQYLIFETANGPMSCDTGDLRELTPGYRTGFGTLDCSELQIADDGTFELLLGPEKPEGYSGNFICTRKPPSKRNPDGEDRYASFISGRQLFYDWENEEPIHLDIVALDHEGDQPAPLTPADAAQNLRKMGSVIRGHMHFWLNFYDKVLNCFGTHGGPEDGAYFMPVNEYNKPNAASSDTGGGMSTNIYAGGIFELEEDEALYVEAEFKGTPVYTSIHLGNLWGESPDYSNHQSSLNHHQMHMDDNNIQRWVISHRDPGVKNWIDTTGLPRGYLSHRWAYSELPPKDQWPTISAKKVKVDEIDAMIPASMPRLTVEERRKDIAIRQAHVRKRFRAF